MSKDRFFGKGLRWFLPSFLLLLQLALPAAVSVPVVIAADAGANGVEKEGYELIWQDEFDGVAIDPANWTFDLGAGGWGNGESQYYTDRSENAAVLGGMLVISALQEKYDGSYFTSARLKTEGLRAFRYGWIEARVKVPEGKGMWPAVWLLGTDFNRIGWPECGEIDIMEYIGKEPDLIMGTAHGPGYSGPLGFSRWNRREFNIADEFHTYAIDWTADRIDWYFDGEHYYTFQKEDIGEREWVFNRPFFILLNLAIGGQLPGPVGLDVTFPKQYFIDYVRVYRKVEK